MRLEKTGRGTMVVVPETLATERPGIFAAGDCVTGPLNVVDAVDAVAAGGCRHGRYLRGDTGSIGPVLSAAEGLNTGGRSEPLLSPLPSTDLSLGTLDRRLVGDDGKEVFRHPMPTLPLEKRPDLRHEVELGYTEEQARLEARRCYQCDFNVFIEAERCTLCTRCDKCLEVCPPQCMRIEHIIGGTSTAKF